MKTNKALVSGVIAIIALFCILFFCYWLGKSVYRYFSEKNEANVKTEEKPSVTISVPVSPEQAVQIYLAPGNPSNANASDPNNYLLVNNYFALSYNRDKGIPNWVAWRISKAELGDLPRPNPDPFRPDERLPKNWNPVKPSDYAGSGFDKGHLCPSADRSASVEGMSATFLMSNMVPQMPDLNRGPWEKLEAYLRTLVRRDNDVYIVAGGTGEKGRLKNKVSIPEKNWKIALVLPAGAPVSSVNEGTRVIAVEMPNVKGIKNTDWQFFRTTVRQIEKSTGYNFFSNLPSHIQDAIETKTDNINN
jgi:endonuclease G